jgi:hypothetical protein
MCKCDYGQCNAGVTGHCDCRCHISSYTAEAKAERQWWHDQLKDLKNSTLGARAVIQLINKLLEQRPL